MRNPKKQRNNCREWNRSQRAGCGLVMTAPAIVVYDKISG